MHNPQRPVVSIVTITFNAQHFLERTILSIARQDYEAIEYIIVDGASSDATMDIVRRHANVVSKWVSEPDKGLYNAMNKGLHMASGSFVWFVNAGDEVPGTDTVSRMMDIGADADVIYGHAMITADDGSEVGLRRLAPPESLTWQSFRNGMLVCHQSFVARRTICPDYDERYRFSADFDWCVRTLRAASPSRVVNSRMILSRFLDGGITSRNIVPGLRERFGIMCRHYGFWHTFVHHVPIAVKFFWFWATRGRF